MGRRWTTPTIWLTRLLLALGGAFLFSDVSVAERHDPARVVVLRLEDSVQPASLQYLTRGVERATREGAALIVLELDTPGGLLESLRKMTQLITNAGPPVAVFVTPSGARAASAGFFLLLSGDVAAMAPGTRAGAAHPVSIDTREQVAGPMVEKATNDTAALARSLAAQRGRSVDKAEEAVRASASYTEQEALEGGLIDVIASDRAELLERLDGQTVKRFTGERQTLALASPSVEVLSPSLGERLLFTIADPQIAYLLMMVGMLAIFVELVNPGAVIPGALGALSLLLALYAFSVLPVNLVGALLLVAGIGSLIAEALVVSHGLLTVAGLICFVFGSVMLVERPLPGTGISVWLVLPTALTVATVVLALLSRVLRARRAPAPVGADALIGAQAEVVVPLTPRGKIFVHGEYWDAVAERAEPRGARVRVTSTERGVLRVEGLSAAR